MVDAYSNFKPPNFVHDAAQVLEDNSGCVFGQEALAKVITQDGLQFFIKDGINEITLGREKNTSDTYFQIGENNTISKKHARIFWDSTEKCWRI